MRKFILAVINSFLLIASTLSFADGSCQYKLTISFAPDWINKMNTLLVSPAYLQWDEIQLRDPNNGYITTLYHKDFPDNTVHNFPPDNIILETNTTSCGPVTFEYMYQAYKLGRCGGNSVVFTLTENQPSSINLVFPTDFSLSGSCY